MDCGRPEWPQRTRNFLNNHSEGKNINVVIWSWCYQVNDKNQETMLNDYLEPMNELEKEFPNVQFVYMTGHLVANGVNKNLNVRNDQIRQYCKTNNKWLFDFAGS